MRFINLATEQPSILCKDSNKNFDTTHFSKLYLQINPNCPPGLPWIHARTMLNSSDPGGYFRFESQRLNTYQLNCISLRYDFYAGTRNMKLLTSGQIRKIHDWCIFSVNLFRSIYWRIWQSDQTMQNKNIGRETINAGSQINNSIHICAFSERIAGS